MSRRPAPPTISSLSDGDYSPEEQEFLDAIDRYKRDHNRPFPAWSEVLQVVLSLGYRKPKVTRK